MRKLGGIPRNLNANPIQTCQMSNYDGFWERVLKEKGLESPGRKEAVDATMKKIAERKAREEAIRKAKSSKNTGKK